MTLCFVLLLSVWGTSKNPKAPRVQVNVNSEFSQTGRTARKRAILDHERRFFRNTAEDTFEEMNEVGKVKLSIREQGALCLDKRLCFNLNFLSKDEWKSARNVLKLGYVEFYVQYKARERDELMKKMQAC